MVGERGPQHSWGEGMHLYRQVATVSTVAAVAALTVLAAPSSAQAGTLNWGECAEPAQEGVPCAQLRAPGAAARRRGGIDLALARRPAPAGQRIGTIVYL